MGVDEVEDFLRVNMDGIGKRDHDTREREKARSPD